METITVIKLLEDYKGFVEEDQIDFLNNEKNKMLDKKDRDHILKNIIELIKKFKNAANERDNANKDKSGKRIKSLSDFIESHEVHEIGKELWEKLCSVSLNYIEPSSKGNSMLFEYIEEATKFEDLLYGMERYYRDHTLHSLWVYFLGENLMRGPLIKLKGDKFNWYLYNDIKKDKDEYKYPPEFVKYSEKEIEKTIIEDVNDKKDAIWCLIALCHDLGYSLEKLEKLNKRVEGVLKYYTISNQTNVGYFLDIEHHFLIAQFLELMAMDIRIVPSDEFREFFEKREKRKKDKENELYKIKEKNSCENSIAIQKQIKNLITEINKFSKFSIEEKKRVDELILIKCYRDDSSYWRLCQSLEKKKHGILSSYLLYKILGLFAESSVMGPAEGWGLSKEEARENLISGNILFAIAQHTFDFAHLDELNSLSDILILADELEEFSRFGRQLQSRKYYDTTANVGIKLIPKNPKKGDKIKIIITYNIESHLDEKDYYHFFWRKAEQICKLYSLGKGDKESEYCKIMSIKMITKSQNKPGILYFLLSENEKETKAKLPKTKINNISKNAGPRNMKCLDDKLFVVLENQKNPLLKEWLNIKD